MLINLICGLLGNIFVLLTGMDSVKRLADASNVPFSYKKYFEKEVLAILMGLIPLLLYVFLFEEITGKYGEIGTLERTSFTVVGALGSWIFKAALGKSKAWITNKIDVKTNELDELKKP